MCVLINVLYNNNYSKIPYNKSIVHVHSSTLKFAYSLSHYFFGENTCTVYMYMYM